MGTPSKNTLANGGGPKLIPIACMMTLSPVLDVASFVRTAEMPVNTGTA